MHNEPIVTRAYARAGLIGNPSDGYFGRTLSFVFKDFFAEVELIETPVLEISGNHRDRSTYRDMQDLYDDVSSFGHYGGIRLLKATIKRFFEYCFLHHIQLEQKNFTVNYRSNIPHRVGLAGSSAIITACLRALLQFYQVKIKKPVMADFVLKVETEELGISAGLQDRVVQVYEGLVYMDFDRKIMEEKGHGIYQNIDISLLPPLYIAFLKNVSEGSEIFHNNIRERFDRGEELVVDAMKFWAELTSQARDCLLEKKPEKLAELINQNFDKRRSIYKISSQNLEMIDVARSTGASAKFSGSGGAIVGTYENEETFKKLEQELGPLGVHVFKPDIKSENE